IVHKRLPFQADATMRKHINTGDHLFVDQHLSHTAELIRSGVLPIIDFAIVEAVSITADGMIIPTTSVGNSTTFVSQAKNIIIEINVAQSEMLEGLHDIYEPADPGSRLPIPLSKVEDRIGQIGIP